MGKYQFVEIKNVCSHCPKRKGCVIVDNGMCVRWQEKFCAAWDITVKQLRELTGKEEEHV